MRKKPGPKPIRHLTEKIEQRFHSSYMKSPSGCWVWHRRVTPKGYAKFNAFGKDHTATRFLFKHILKIQIPGGIVLCHRCDNPLCVNPDHIFLGTVKDNSQDMVSKNRHLAGDKSPQAKLDWPSVDKILTDYLSGKYTQAELSKIYGVSATAISKIVLNQRWVR